MYHLYAQVGIEMRKDGICTSCYYITGRVYISMQLQYIERNMNVLL